MHNECSREALMQRVQSESFAAQELQLFLDTHPACPEALAALRAKLESRKQAIQAFEQRFGPLTLDGMVNACAYNWIDHPWPWEEEA